MSENNKTLIYVGLGAAALVGLYAICRCCCKRCRRKQVEASKTKSIPKVGEEGEGPKPEEEAKSECSSMVPPDFVCPPHQIIPKYTNTQASLGGIIWPAVKSAVAAYRYDRYYHGPSSFMPSPGAAYIRSIGGYKKNAASFCSKRTKGRRRPNMTKKTKC